MTAATLQSNSCGVVMPPIVPGMDLSGTPKEYSVSWIESADCDVSDCAVIYSQVA